MPNEALSKALSLDLDGPTIWRIIPVQWGAVKKYRKDGLNIYAAQDIRPLIDTRFKSPFLHSEIPSFYAHAIRFVFPDAKKALLDLTGIDIYGNTGRSDKIEWQEMTRRTLQRSEIRKRFKQIFHKPEGFRTVESKISHIDWLKKNYDKVAPIDDNPADALPIAATFEDVNVCIVRDWSTNYFLSEVNLKEDFPNVTVVPTLRQALRTLYKTV